MSGSVIDRAIETVQQLTQIVAGSEDDLIAKVVLPFFATLGYGSELYELKYAIAGYQPNRRGLNQRPIVSSSSDFRVG
jgi:hypothetical protein